jgi:hypothetical protein
MNDDFKKILTEMPKSILLYNDETKEVVLANEVCKNLIGTNNELEIVNKNEILELKVFSKFDSKDPMDLNDKN